MNTKLNHKVREAQNAIWKIEEIIGQEMAIKLTGYLQQFKELEEDWEKEIVICDICNKEKPLSQVQTIYIENWGCVDCVQNHTAERLAEKLKGQVLPYDFEDIVSTIRGQI